MFCLVLGVIIPNAWVSDRAFILLKINFEARYRAPPQATTLRRGKRRIFYHIAFVSLRYRLQLLHLRPITREALKTITQFPALRNLES